MGVGREIFLNKDGKKMVDSSNITHFLGVNPPFLE
jgi:hypothetical protein